MQRSNSPHKKPPGEPIKPAEKNEAALYDTLYNEFNYSNASESLKSRVGDEQVVLFDDFVNLKKPIVIQLFGVLGAESRLGETGNLNAVSYVNDINDALYTCNIHLFPADVKRMLYLLDYIKSQFEASETFKLPYYEHSTAMIFKKKVMTKKKGVYERSLFLAFDANENPIDAADLKTGDVVDIQFTFKPYDFKNKNERFVGISVEMLGLQCLRKKEQVSEYDLTSMIPKTVASVSQVL
ncbi:hypothetical protein HDV02_005296, partial [Globomyces sp. JEL0801]